MNKKILVTVVAAALLLCVAVGGTIAYLTAQSDTVTNTFSPSTIGVTLKESENLDLQMVPGATITKDPKASITTGSEPAWLFVKIEKSENFDQYMTYTVAEGWTLVEGTNNVYAREVQDIAADTEKDIEAQVNIGKEFAILKEDTVTVLGTVTSEMMETAKTTKLTLTFTAYASQLMKNNTEKFTAAEAWQKTPGYVAPAN